MATHGFQALKTLLLLMPVFMCQVVLNSSKIEGPVKSDQLTVMISITSGISNCRQNCTRPMMKSNGTCWNALIRRFMKPSIDCVPLLFQDHITAT